MAGAAMTTVMAARIVVATAGAPRIPATTMARRIVVAAMATMMTARIAGAIVGAKHQLATPMA